MNTPRDDELEGLLNKLADSSLMEDEERRLADILRTDAAARRQYRQFMALHADLHWDYAAAAVAEPNIPMPPRRWTRAWKAIGRHLWMAAGVLLVAMIGGFLLFQRPPRDSQAGRPVMGRLTRLAGVVQISDRQKVQEVRQDADLRAGVMVDVTGLTGLALLRLDDGTEVSLVGETRVECRRQAGQTTITLHKGHLSASVIPQAAGRPLLIHTPSAEMQVLGTRLAISADEEASELGVLEGRVRLRRLTDGKTIEVGSGQFAVASQRTALEASPWPATPDMWSENFESGLPDDWRYGQWLNEKGADGSRGVVRAARQFALDGSDSQFHRITLPKRWTGGLWRLQEDSHLHFTYKMSRPGWFHVMIGVRSDDLNPSHVGNYEVQSSFWSPGKPDEWQTVSIPFSAFRKNVRGVEYAALPALPPRAGDIVYLMWFNTGDVDRGLVIDRIWIDRRPSENSP